jgi:trigger factor
MLLDIIADDHEVNDAVEKAYRTVSRQIRVPGFRPGKAPRRIIDRLYGPDVYMQEAHRVVVDKLYQQAVKEQEIIPVGQPSVEITELEPLQFKITVPVFPTIEVGDYLSVRAEPRDAAVGDSDVEAVLERMQRSASPWVDVTDERTPKEGDQVTIDLKVQDGDEEFDKPVEGADFVLGESNLFDQLREAIEGMKVGETANTEITFDADDEKVNERVRGKTLSYEITLTGLKERQILEINDEFAKNTAGVDSVEALRTAILNDVHAGKTSEMRNALFTEIIDKIAEGATLELPEVMVHDAVHEEMNATQQRLAQQGLTLEAYLRMQGQSQQEFHDELFPGVTRRLRNSLLLREIAEKEGIAVDDGDIDSEIDAITSGSANSAQMRDLYSKEGYFRKMLRDDLFDRKLTDRLVEIATEGRGAVTNGFVEPEVVEAAPVTDEAEAVAPMGIAAAPEAAEADAEITTPAGGVLGTGESDCVEGYPIKGNASSMIYHIPGQSSYERTIPEMCFATEEDAVAAGYRASKAAGGSSDEE